MILCFNIIFYILLFCLCIYVLYILYSYYILIPNWAWRAQFRILNFKSLPNDLSWPTTLKVQTYSKTLDPQVQLNPNPLTKTPKLFLGPSPLKPNRNLIKPKTKQTLTKPKNLITLSVSPNLTLSPKPSKP